MLSNQSLLWIAFNCIVAGILYIDLGILNRKSHAVSLKEAAGWSVSWISLALLFCAGIYWELGPHKAMEFLTGYLIEYSLSVDNLFVFIMIFTYFNVPPQYQPRILHWGILGAVVMRFFFIFVGITLLHLFHWVIYLFGGLLILTGIRMLREQEKKIEPHKNPVLKLFKKLMPFKDRHPGNEFFVREQGVFYATPLFATLLVIEASDLMFAVDSIPAILAITTDTFIVYTSNVFAILGLRSLYFLLAGIMGLFRFLKTGISIILCYVGVKMVLVDIYKVPIAVSLGVVLGLLTISVLASMLIPEKSKPEGG